MYNVRETEQRYLPTFRRRNYILTAHEFAVKIYCFSIFFLLERYKSSFSVF